MTEVLYQAGASRYDTLFARVTQAFIPALIAAAQIAPGHGVLDVATGTGAAARAAMAQAGPGARVIAGDISTEMLEIARHRPDNAGVTFEQFDGQALPFPAASFDRVICQLGLAFFDGPVLGLMEFRRVLTLGGRAVAVVNSLPERSLFTRIGTVIAQHVPARVEQLNRYASIRTPERLHRLFQAASFQDIAVQRETRAFTFESFDDYFSGTAAGAGISGQEYVKLPLAIQSVVRETMRRSFPDGGTRRPFIVEMEGLIGAGSK